MPEVSGVILVLAIVVAAYVLVRASQKLGKRRNSATAGAAQARSPRPDRGHHLDAPAELQRWEVEMHEIARDLSARIDTKMGLLEQLIRTAEREAHRLERAIAEAQGQPAHRGEAAFHPIATEAAEAAKQALDGATSQRLLPRQQQVYRLADQGLATAEIARQVGSPIGEVELILSLRSNV